jgi:transposase
MQGKVLPETSAMPPVYVGIDVCKARLDVHIHPIGRRFGVANDAGGWRRLRRELAGHAVARLVMEATSKYHRAVHRHLAADGVAVAVVNPLRARLFAEACGVLAKTDAVDARLLALMAERLDPVTTPVVAPNVEALQELASARTAAVAARVTLAQQRETTGTAALRAELARQLGNADRHIARLEAMIDACITADPLLARRRHILRSIPGIGQITATTLIASFAELGSLTDKQAAALAGLAPHPRDSGPVHGKRHVRGGRPGLRAALYMAALSAARCNPDLATFSKRLRANGKPPKVAIIAVARKLLALANALVRQNRTWSQIQPCS